MAEIVGVVLTAVSCVVPCFTPPGIRRIKRLREFKRNFQKLKRAVDNLKAERTSLQRRVNLAKKIGDGIEENVENWLKRAEELEVATQNWLDRASKIIGDDQEAVTIRKDEGTVAAGEIGGDAEITAAAAGEIREGIQAAAADAREIGEGEETVAAAAGEIRADEEKTAAEKRCFKGLCPNLTSRYQLSEEAETLLDHVVTHLDAGKFDKKFYPVIPEDPRLSNKDYKAFESQTSTLKKVILSLSDPNVNIVGIYGMGGIGKTTLAKEVAKQSETNKLFDSVIFIEVTEKPDIMKIQKEIAGRLGLTLSSEEADSVRAGKLFRLLKNENKILIIFDDIWDHFDLQAIGIPLRDEYKVCKVLLTSRSNDVLEKMDSQRSIPVELLDDEEAWQLFKKRHGNCKFESLARQVAKKCARLPIVIVAVAGGLKNKELYEWQYALQKLNIPNELKKIELSFSWLEPEQLKTILLIGYANITSIDKLLMYGMGVALFEDVKVMEGRRSKVLTLVRQLKDSGLLLDSNTPWEDFSMHDVVREVAMSIASRDPEVFTNPHEELELPEKKALEGCHSIVLKDVKTGEFPQVLESQQLKLLAISQVPSISNLKIHDEFFTRLTELKVLVLSNIFFLSLPSSLRMLTNLRALGLYGCWLDDIAIIGNLKKLEILSLKCSYIKQLPKEVGRLTRLKSLDLRDCLYLGVIAPYVLSSLSHLEELYMGGFGGWEEEVLNKDRKNVSLDELKHLSNLTCLEIKIQDAKTLPRDLFFNKLERYNIEIGQSTRVLYGVWMPKSCRNFSLSLINTNISLNKGHIMQLKEIEDLRIDGSQDMKNVLCGLDRDGFQQLKYLQVRDNGNLLYIVEEHATNNAFPVLEELLIHNLINLKKICQNQLTTELSFSKLRKISVKNCANLENIFSFSIARRLQQLHSVYISDCENMTEIFAIEREDESNNNISEVIDIELNQLHSLHISSLPKLKNLEYNSNCSNTLFSGKVVLPNLEMLELNLLNVEKIWQNPVATTSSGIQNLTWLILSGCNNLRYLFSSSMIRSFVRLQHLKIQDCPYLKEIVVVDEKRDVVFAQLQSLWLEGLENLTKFSSVDSIQFSSLEQLVINRCYPLREFLVKNISTDSTEISLPFFNEKVVLPRFKVLNLNQLTNEKPVQNIWPGLDCNQNLTRLILYRCNNFRCLFSSSSIGIFDRLQYLEIQDCSCLEEIVVGNERKDAMFPKLQFLKMIFLKNLLKFCSGDSIEFPFLKKLEIKYCPKLKGFVVKNISTDLTEISLPFFNEKVALQSLEELEMHESNVESIWQSPVATTSSGIQNLTSLTLGGRNNLRCLFSSSMIKSFVQLQRLRIWGYPCLEEIIVIDGSDSIQFRSLKELEIYNCPKLREFSVKNISTDSTKISLPFFNEKVALPKLELLKLNKINVERIWQTSVAIMSSGIQNLTRLTIHQCDNLKYIFSSSMIGSFDQLHDLDINNCRALEEVMVIDDEDELRKEERKNNVLFVFPRLISLTLRYLPKLTAFFSTRYSTEWPVSFCVEKIFPNLKNLIVEGKSISTIWEFSNGLFGNVTYLEVTFRGSTVISSLDFLQRFHSIKMLQITGQIWGDFCGYEMSADIRNLNECSDLKHILKEEFNMDHWIYLNIKYCDNLVNLFVPSSTSFRNLTTLVVYKCNGLTNIVTSSTAKSMGQLRKMKIIGCYRITELVLADDGDEANDYEIVFSELQELVLKHLGRLTSFCSANYTLKFPSLEEILVEKCPEMKSFTEGNLTTPKLQKVKQRRNGKVKKCWKGDLNTTIEELYKGKQMICNDDEEVNTEDDNEDDVSGSDDEHKG